MINKIRLLIVASVFILTGCSHVSQMASAEKKESASISKTDAAWRKLEAREADYNREVKIANELPQSLQTRIVIDSLLDLQYQLTGNAASSQAQLQKQVDALLKDDQAAHDALKKMAKSDQGIILERDKAVIERDKAVAAANALAMQAASVWDKYDKLWDMVYAFIALGILVLILRVLYIFGVFGATTASKL